MLIFAAAQRVIGDTPLVAGRLGILVDEELGADVARAAKQAGFVLAMPVEASGSKEFKFEYGDDFPAHIEAFDPDWVKVLVRFNPEDPAELREAQTKTLKRLQRLRAAQPPPLDARAAGPSDQRAVGKVRGRVALR